MSTGSHHEQIVVSLDNMIIWNDKLAGKSWGNELVRTYANGRVLHLVLDREINLEKRGSSRAVG